MERNGNVAQDLVILKRTDQYLQVLGSDYKYRTLPKPLRKGCAADRFGNHGDGLGVAVPALNDPGSVHQATLAGRSVLEQQANAGVSTSRSLSLDNAEKNKETPAAEQDSVVLRRHHYAGLHEQRHRLCCRQRMLHGAW
jgi:hypothetical protein